MVKEIQARSPREAVEYLEGFLKKYHKSVQTMERAYWEKIALRVKGTLKEYGKDTVLGLSIMLQIFSGAKEDSAVKKHLEQ